MLAELVGYRSGEQSQQQAEHGLRRNDDAERREVVAEVQCVERNENLDEAERYLVGEGGRVDEQDCARLRTAIELSLARSAHREKRPAPYRPMSRPAAPLTMRSAVAFAMPGPIMMPCRPPPVATWTPSTPGTGPRTTAPSRCYGAQAGGLQNEFGVFQ